MKWRFFPVKKFEIILPEGTDAYKSLSENTEKSKISRAVLTSKYFKGEVNPQKFHITLSGMLGGWLTTGDICVIKGNFDTNKIIFSIEVHRPFKFFTIVLLVISILLWYYHVFTQYTQIYNVDNFINDLLSIAIVIVLTKILWEIRCWISQKIIFHRMKKFLDVVEIKKLS